jgi:hypothetical protein
VAHGSISILSRGESGFLTVKVGKADRSYIRDFEVTQGSLILAGSAFLRPDSDGLSIRYVQHPENNDYRAVTDLCLCV